jgi:molybdopterin molybdotransferase
MLSFESARQQWLTMQPSLGPEVVSVRAASNRVLPSAVVSPSCLPPFTHSAMDGYALASSELTGSAAHRLAVVGESRTGKLAPSLVSGSACRIFTGAQLPTGADAVIIQENTIFSEGYIEFSTPVFAHQNVRFKGETLAIGQEAVPAGTRLGTAHLSLLAALEFQSVVVSRRPQVVILTTGSELPGIVTAQDVAVGIPESNSFGLQALAEQTGAEVRLVQAVGDHCQETAQAIEQALEHCDLLVTVGGVSVGTYDVVKEALQLANVAIDFWKVAIKPGKPLVVGHRGKTMVLGLPGNPVSALLTFALFGIPALRTMQGDRSPLPWMLPCQTQRVFAHRPGRTEFLGVHLQRIGDQLLANPTQNFSSASLPGLANCDGLAVIPEQANDLPPGSHIDVFRLQDLLKKSIVYVLFYLDTHDDIPSAFATRKPTCQRSYGSHFDGRKIAKNGRVSQGEFANKRRLFHHRTLADDIPTGSCSNLFGGEQSKLYEQWNSALGGRS